MNKQTPSKKLQQFVAVFLCVCLVGSLLPMQVWAKEQPQTIEQGDLPEVLNTSDGEVAVQDEWEDLYPYGTFAFGTYQADLGEPGAKTPEGDELQQSLLLPVYRIGGTRGRVTAKIIYSPVVTTDESGTQAIYDYAASGKQDLLIEVEKPNPLAAYQQIGLPDAEREMLPAPSVGIHSRTDDDNNLILSLTGAEEAAAFRWQYKGAMGSWKDVLDGTESVLTLTGDDYSAMGITGWDSLDFRCILTVEDVLLCTVSLRGENYVQDVPLSPIPDGLVSPEEPEYEAVAFEGDYDVYELSLTFAEGETVKYLRVTALEDELPELSEMGMFTIVGCEGGEYSELSNALTVMISDNDPCEPSVLGFEVKDIVADRAEGFARATVKRTGGKNYNVTVDYTTEDITAVAGVDYAAKTGTMAFVGSVDEVTVPIEIIANETTEDLRFALTISNLRGGGDGLCTIENDRLEITLSGNAAAAGEKAGGQNLATVLSHSEGVSADTRVNISEDALIPAADTQENYVIMREDTPGEAEFTEPVQMRSHTVNAGFRFTRTGLGYKNDLSDKYWRDWEIVFGQGNGRDAADRVDFTEDIRFYLYDAKQKQYVWDDKGLLGTAGSRVATVIGTDSNNNSIDIRVAERSDSSSDYFKNYLEMSANYIGDVMADLGDVGHLYDQLEFASYLREVGTKSRSGSGKSRFIKPKLTLGVTRAESYLGGDAINQVTTYDFEIEGKESHVFHWWTSRYGANTTLSMFSGPLGDNDPATVTGSLKSVALPMNADLNIELALVMAKQWSGEEMSLTDCTERMQKSERTEVDIPIFRLHRRVLTGTDSIPVILYTANDTNEAENLNWTPIDSGFYSNLNPALSLLSGGVTASGDLYVGSVLQFDTGNIPEGFRIPEGGIFITDVATGEKAPFKMDALGSTNSDDPQSNSVSWKVTLDSGTLTDAQMAAKYQINILLERAQTIEIDLGPSLGNKTHAEVMQNFAPASGKAVPKADCSVTSTTANTSGFYFADKTTLNLTGSQWQYKGGSVYKTKTDLMNIQTINFHKDHRDQIIYNGDSYAGDDDIKIGLADLATPILHFTYYHRDFLTAISPMVVNIISTDLYYDGNGDGKISGMFDETHMIFNVSDEDEFLGHANGDYPESTFKPKVDQDRVIDENGNVLTQSVSGNKVHQYYLKVYYTMRPKSITVPQGANASDKAQVLPAFLSAATNQKTLMSLTPEQRAYRFIKGANTDGHLMYGAEASKTSYIDIPLGGDLSFITYTSKTEAVRDKDDKIIDAVTTKEYTWDPNYIGNLIVNYDSPTPIIDTNNITGHPVSMAGENLIPTSGESTTYSYNDTSLAKMNGYLGAFAGRTTFALCAQPQKTTIDHITDLGSITPDAYTIGNVSSSPNADSVMNLSDGGEPGSTGGDTPGDDTGFPEFGADLGVELPSLELELGDYATLIMDGYQVGFAIGIPLFKYEDTNYSGSEKETVNGNTTTKSKVDENGDLHETITSKDEKAKTSTETERVTKKDPNDPNKRTVESMTVETDEKGNKTYKKETKQQEMKKDKDGKVTWEDVGKSTIDTTPPAPSQPDPKKTNKELFEERISDANGQLATLAGFVNACKSKQKDALKDFWNGAWEDDSLNNAKNGNGTSTKVEVSFTVQLSLMFEYNPVDNCHYFKSAGISATLGIELSAQHRFSACPLVYVYIKLGISVELAVSLSCTRNAKLGSEIKTFESGSLTGLTENKPVIFKLDMKSGKNKIRGFHIDLLGTVYMEVYDNASLTGELLTSGALSGDGSEKEVLLKAYNKVVYVRLTPLRGKVIAENLKPIVGASSKVVFDGLNITPSIELEAGIGVGVELLKFEVFVKTSIAITITMGGYLEETDRYEGFYISSFNWGLAVGFNFTALFFNYSQECIAIAVEGEQHGTGGYFSWNISASAVDGNYPLWSKDTFTAADGKHLDGEPEPPDGVNIGPEDRNIVFRDADGYAIEPEGFEFPDDCDWDMMRNVAAWRWGGGDFKGEIPQDGDFSIANKTGVKVEFTVPDDTGKIRVYFDGTLSYKVETTSKTKENVKKSPVTIDVGDNETKVILTLKKGTKIDRYEVIENKDTDGGPGRAPSISPKTSAGGEEINLVSVSAPTDVSRTQSITRSKASGTRAITPAGTDDFELSGVNTTGDAKKLVSGLATGYSYKLFSAGDDNFILYPYSIDGTAQLVMSKVVMTGDLSTVSGLENPIDPSAAEPYLKVDNDSFGDLDYNVSVNGTAVTVVWSAYYDDTQANSAVDAARNVVVKRATLDIATDSAFSAPEILTEGVGNYRFLPVQSGTDTVWVESDGANDGNDELAAYLLATNPGLTIEMLQTGTVTKENAKYAAAVYRYMLQSDVNLMYGKNSKLCASNGATDIVTGEHIENIETGVVGGTQVVLYSTTETAYFNGNIEDPVTMDTLVPVEPDDFDANTELGIIRRLYIRTLNGTGWGDAYLIQTVVDFDSCDTDNIDSKELKDGIYVQNALAVEQADPYFGKLQFLSANLDSADANETVLLYEMGGNTYLMRQADITSLLSGGEATLVPIFTETTGNDVSIGSDGQNLAVVFTSNVPGNLSNAIYTAWWDRNIGGWGSPTLLAMRHLQVYEDGIRDGMSPEEMEQAYLGKITTKDGHTGSDQVLTFSDLQMSVRTVGNAGGTDAKQLLVMTMGSMQKVEEKTVLMDEATGKTLDTIAPVGSATLGFYSIAFGAGEQALGQAKLSLANYDFSAGNHLIGGLEFMNTGTAAVRASDANPITVQLKVREGAEPAETDFVMAEWQLKNSIRSGASVLLSFKSAQIINTLPVGTTFYLTVTEDTTYFGENSFRDMIDNLLVVEQKPELSISGFTAELTGIENGKAYFTINAVVTNTGNADANNAYIQFSYDTGRKDASGVNIYNAANITGSTLNASEQQNAKRGAITGENFSAGVYMLKHGSETYIQKGKYRTVTGTLCLPTSYFVNEDDFNGLHLRAEVYSDFDSPDYNDALGGLYSSDHNEYNGANNASEITVKPKTIFEAPEHITSALGTTLNLPIDFTSTADKNDIQLTEISDGTEGWEPRMGVCYYDASRKVIVAAPNAEAQALIAAGKDATGILQLRDSATNSIAAIAYTVGAMGNGVNIYRDDNSFTFRNKNGTATNLYASVSENPGWLFTDVGVDMIWNNTFTGEIPMNNDLAEAYQDGAYVEFYTVADTITVYFSGEITVTTTLNNTSKTCTSPTKISFNNNNGDRHKVRITAAKGTYIDRYVATYKTNPVPATDPDAPQIYWNRSFPQTASVQTGEGVTMRCYIMDAGNLGSVQFGDVTLTTSTSPKLVKLENNV
ncbi:MAG: hypothetical protein IJK23_01740 [Clostridia bacterium]|nr:hypothetical protein [Clostridia bacterium]